MDVIVRDLPPQHVAYMTYEGPLDRVGAIFESLQAWARERDIPDRPITGVFVETKQPLDEEGRPHGASEGHGEAWLPVADDVEGDEDVQLKDTEPARAACATYEGNPEGILRFTDALRRFLRREGLTLANENRLVYHAADWNNISEWVIEVQVPVHA